VAGVVVAWVAVVWAAPRVQVGPGLHELALFCHLAALLLGFGAALTVEWFGLLWLLRRRPLSAVVQTAHGAHLPIWLGLAGLAGSGVLLTPERLPAATTVKLVVVLVIALNGLYARRLQRRLAAGPAPARPIMLRAAGAALVSQCGWWTATVIGFLTTRS
jgi:hypothetical protein